jgi:hypothetical protein
MDIHVMYDVSTRCFSIRDGSKWSRLDQNMHEGMEGAEFQDSMDAGALLNAHHRTEQHGTHVSCITFWHTCGKLLRHCCWCYISILNPPTEQGCARTSTPTAEPVFSSTAMRFTSENACTWLETGHFHLSPSSSLIQSASSLYIPREMPKTIVSHTAKIDAWPISRCTAPPPSYYLSVDVQDDAIFKTSLLQDPLYQWVSDGS